MGFGASEFECQFSGILTDEARHLLETQFGAYGLEPVLPGREELIEKIGKLQELLFSLGKNNSRAEQIIKQFLDYLVLDLDLKNDEPLRIGGVISYANQSDEDNGWGFLLEEGELFGDFKSLAIGPWYEMPTGEVVEEAAPYLRQDGLAVGLTNSRLVMPGTDDLWLPGMTIVPLHHGQPTIHRVIRVN